MANMGAREKESDLAVWNLELVELVCFLKIYCKQQQKNKRSLACIVFANRMILMKRSV